MDDELSRLFHTPQKLTVDFVRLVGSGGASPNQCNNRNRYMLHLVAQHGNAAMAAVLLAYGAYCDRVTSTDIALVPLNHDLKLMELSTGGTILQIACLNGDREVVDVLLEDGASKKKLQRHMVGKPTHGRRMLRRRPHSAEADIPRRGPEPEM